MQKALIIILSFLMHTVAAQQLQFDKKFVQSEDRWVAFPADSIGHHAFGFIYIDASAGMTLDYAGTFSVDSKGNFVPTSNTVNRSMKYRLQPGNQLIAHIPDDKLQGLKVEPVPEWLAIYKEGEGTIGRLQRWGYLYNGWGECLKALDYLEKAAAIDLKYDGVAVELAYSYNCLERYNDAIKVLQGVLKSLPKDAYINKEYIYALAKSNQLDKAKEIYKKTHLADSDNQYQAENAYNILQGYYLMGNARGFKDWLAKTKDLYPAHVSLQHNVDIMIKEIGGN